MQDPQSVSAHVVSVELVSSGRSGRGQPEKADPIGSSSHSQVTLSITLSARPIWHRLDWIVLNRDIADLFAPPTRVVTVPVESELTSSPSFASPLSPYSAENGGKPIERTKYEYNVMRKRVRPHPDLQRVLEPIQTRRLTVDFSPPGHPYPASSLVRLALIRSLNMLHLGTY